MECPTTFIFDKSLKKYFPNKQIEEKNIFLLHAFLSCLALTTIWNTVVLNLKMFLESG